MSERGMILALQRIHDDPGFTDRVADDPEGTLGLYDLSEDECNTLIGAVKNQDDTAISQMASGVGIDWTADHIGGAGALKKGEVSLEGSTARTGISGPGTLPGDGYEGVMPERTAGT